MRTGIFKLFNNELNNSEISDLINQYNLSLLFLDTNYDSFSIIPKLLSKFMEKNYVGIIGKYEFSINESFTLDMIFLSASRNDLIFKGRVLKEQHNQSLGVELSGNGANLSVSFLNESSKSSVISSIYPSLNEYHHIIIVWNNSSGESSLKLFLDGELEGVSSLTSFLDINDSTLNVDIRGRNPIISQFVIYNRSLTIDEVLQNFIKPGSIKKDKLIEVTKLEWVQKINVFQYDNFYLIKFMDG
jgi:hypothetical protein